MPFLELSLVIDAARQPEVEAALEALGAQAVTLRDADAETPDERAIFEPGVGETPIWHSVILDALFEAGADRPGLLAALGAQCPGIEPGQVSFREVADQDWERAWMDRFKPMAFGRRLRILPWNHDADGDASDVIVRLDPGLAFGTGTHPTTALCLEWLDGLDLEGQSLVDFGCGSGVLAIAALKLGARRVIGIDNDPQALSASADNARRNGVEAALELYRPEDAPTGRHDALVANILAGPLHDLAPRMAALCAPGAPMALSGILEGQQHALLERYAEWFEALDTVVRDGWVRISGQRLR